MPEETSTSSKAQSTAKLALWLTFIAFVLIVLVFRTKISEIRFGNEGVSAKMVTTQDVDKLSPEDRKAASDDLAQRVNTLETRARANAGSATQTANSAAPQDQPDTAPVSEATYQQPAQAEQASIPNIAGAWGSPIGLLYQVTQYGNYVLISEVNQGVVEAAAAGPISGWSFSLPSQNLLNRTGVLTLSVSADQRHMTGQYVDNFTGQVYQIYLNR